MFSDEIVKDLMNRAQPQIAEAMSQTMKDSIISVLEDEDIAEAVTQYGDALYTRYSKKFFGSIGGIQRGVNHQTQQLNPLNGLITDEGSINVKGIIGRILAGAIQKQVTPQALSRIQPNNGGNQANIPEM